MNFVTNKKQQRDSSVEFGHKYPHRFRSFVDRPGSPVPSCCRA
jgi:hypothetical protein